MDQWANFFLGQVGASAALGGLLFVAASLNLPRILQYRGLPERALAALALLLAILVVSSLMLVPGQPVWLFGAEVLAAGLFLAGLGLRLERGIRAGWAPAPVSGPGGDPAPDPALDPALDPAGDAVRLDQSRRRHPVNVALYALAVLPYAAGGAVLIGGDTAGLYLVAAAIVMSFFKAVLDAWVLLVEINR